MDPARIAIRCLFSFLFLLAMLRLSGKRLISHTSAFDFVLSLIAGDLVDDAIFAEVPMLEFVIAIAVLVLLEVSASIVVYTSKKALWGLEGKPAIILQNGTLDRQGTRSEKISEEEAEALLRLKGLEKENWIQVKIGTIEASGEHAVIKKAPMQDAPKKHRSRLRE